MKKSTNSLTANLRQKAEEQLKNKNRNKALQHSDADILKLIHELEVHQIELELQNEELMYAKEQAEIATSKYTELYDFAPSGYFTLSKDGKIIELNLCGAKMLGKERSRLINSPFGFFVSEKTRSVFNLFLDKVFNSKTKESCELTMSGNGDLPVYIYLTGIVTEDGEQCIVTIVDITERIQMEQELITAKEKAEESDRLKTSFLSNMSHEFRTPMSGILGFTRLLKKPKLTGEQQQEYIDSIEKSGARMLNIINDIINISKVETGQMVTTISETNVNEQIENIYSLYRHEAEEKGMHFSIKNRLHSHEATIKTDAEKSYYILSNLVKNAIKFSHKGSIEISCEKKGKYIEFYVKDTGIGIRQDQNEMIFEKFRQGSESDTRDFQGAGLGLAISKAYAEMLGGKIWVESEFGIGSKFYFTLPYIT
jgi:PAS domain S-box-containing protein